MGFSVRAQSEHGYRYVAFFDAELRMVVPSVFGRFSLRRFTALALRSRYEVSRSPFRRLGQRTASATPLSAPLAALGLTDSLLYRLFKS